MIQTISKEIDGTKYEITQLGAKQGRSMLVLLVKVLGPSLARLADNPKGDTIGGALYELSEHLTAPDFEHVCEVFGKTTEFRDGSRTVLLDLNEQEQHFAGRYGSMLKWLGACLEANFQDFFDMSASAAKTAGFVQSSQSQTALDIRKD